MKRIKIIVFYLEDQPQIRELKRGELFEKKLSSTVDELFQRSP